MEAKHILILGVLTLRLAMRKSGRWTSGSRIYLALLGVAALFVWAGFLIGSAMLIVSAIIPTRLDFHSGDVVRNRDSRQTLPTAR